MRAKIRHVKLIVRNRRLLIKTCRACPVTVKATVKVMPVNGNDILFSALSVCKGVVGSSTTKLMTGGLVFGVVSFGWGGECRRGAGPVLLFVPMLCETVNNRYFFWRSEG